MTNGLTRVLIRNLPGHLGTHGAAPGITSHATVITIDRPAIARAPLAISNDTRCISNDPWRIMNHTLSIIADPQSITRDTQRFIRGTRGQLENRRISFTMIAES